MSRFLPRVTFPTLFSLLDESDNKWFNEHSEGSGLTVSEDDHHVYVEASVPGVKADHIEMTFDKGILWIKAEDKEEHEDKKRKYYHRAQRSFSYRLAVPGLLDEHKTPEAVVKDGVLKVTFVKTQKVEPKKIQVRHHES